MRLDELVNQRKRKQVRKTGNHWASSKIEEIINNADLRAARVCRVLTREHEKRLKEVKALVYEMSVEDKIFLGKIESWFETYKFLPKSYLKGLRLIKAKIKEEVFL